MKFRWVEREGGGGRGGVNVSGESSQLHRLRNCELFGESV